MRIPVRLNILYYLKGPAEKFMNLVVSAITSGNIRTQQFLDSTGQGVGMLCINDV